MKLRLNKLYTTLATPITGQKLYFSLSFCLYTNHRSETSLFLFVVSKSLAHDFNSCK